MIDIKHIGDAALAVEAALTRSEQDSILAQFRHSNLDGADVADILDILSNQDALLEYTEPFYERGEDQTVRLILGWPMEDGQRWRSMVISMAVYAIALLEHRVPSISAVADLVRRAVDA